MRRFLSAVLALAFICAAQAQVVKTSPQPAVTNSWFYGLGTTVQTQNYDPAAVAIFNAFTTPPTTARKRIINSTVISLKSLGIWDQIDVLYMTAAADSQAALINWKSPGTFTASPVNAPTFVADRGYTGNGTTSRLDTGWTPSVNAVKFTQDNASVWAWVLTNAGANKSVLGSYSPEPVALLNPRNAVDISDLRLNNALAGFVGIATTDSTGLTGAQRRSSTDLRGFKNGVEVISGSVASTGVPTVSQWICASNPAVFDARQIAFVAYGSSLSGMEAAFYTIILTYMQAVGAA